MEKCDKNYKVIDVSGDVGLEIRGRTYEDLFVNSAIGFYSLVTDTKLIKPVQTLDVCVEREEEVNVFSNGPETSPIELLIAGWLNELIYHLDVDGFISNKVENFLLTKNKVCASLIGEEFEIGRHESRLLIKAATYHGLNLQKDGDCLVFNCILDI